MFAFTFYDCRDILFKVVRWKLCRAAISLFPFKTTVTAKLTQAVLYSIKKKNHAHHICLCIILALQILMFDLGTNFDQSSLL